MKWHIDWMETRLASIEITLDAIVPLPLLGEGLSLPVPPIVDHGEGDRSKKEESPSHQCVKATRIKSGQKIEFRHSSHQRSVRTTGRSPSCCGKSALQVHSKSFELAPTLNDLRNLEIGALELLRMF